MTRKLSFFLSLSPDPFKLQELLQAKLNLLLNYLHPLPINLHRAFVMRDLMQMSKSLTAMHSLRMARCKVIIFHHGYFKVAWLPSQTFFKKKPSETGKLDTSKYPTSSDNPGSSSFLFKLTFNHITSSQWCWSKNMISTRGGKVLLLHFPVLKVLFH